MRILGGTGLIRVEVDEWAEVSAVLLAAGYHFVREETGMPRSLWNRDMTRCVGNVIKDAKRNQPEYYHLDVCVLPDLAKTYVPTPLPTPATVTSTQEVAHAKENDDAASRPIPRSEPPAGDLSEYVFVAWTL